MYTNICFLPRLIIYNFAKSYDEVSLGLTSPAAVPVHIGADSLKKPYHIITLRFSEFVKDHAKYKLARRSELFGLC